MLSPPLLPLSPVWSHAAMGGARGCGVAVPSLSLNQKRVGWVVVKLRSGGDQSL